MLRLAQLGQAAAGGAGLALQCLHVADGLQPGGFLLFDLQFADVVLGLQLAQALQGVAGDLGLLAGGVGLLRQLRQFALGGRLLRGQPAGLRLQQLGLGALRVFQPMLAAQQALRHCLCGIALFHRGAGQRDHRQRLPGAHAATFGHAGFGHHPGGRGQHRGQALGGHQLPQHGGTAGVAAQDQQQANGYRCHGGKPGQHPQRQRLRQ